MVFCQRNSFLATNTVSVFTMFYLGVPGPCGSLRKRRNNRLIAYVSWVAIKRHKFSSHSIT